MSLTSVRTDVVALSSHRHLAGTHASTARAVERLSSGLRVNRAADDAAGLAISEGLRSRVGGLRVGLRAAQDAVSALTVVDGALGRTHDVLQRLRDLTVRALSTGSLGAEGGDAIAAEAAALTGTLDSIAAGTTWGGRPVLDGTWSAAFLVGPGAEDARTVRLALDASARGLGVDGLGLAGRLTDVTTLDGRPDVAGVPGSPSTFTFEVMTDTDVADLVGGLPAGRLEVDGAAVDLTGVATVDALGAALAAQTGLLVSRTGDGAVRLTATSDGPYPVVVTGAPGTTAPGTAEVLPSSGSPASVSGAVDLDRPVGVIRSSAGGELNLATLTARLAAAPDRGAALASALEEAFSGTVASVHADGRFTLSTVVSTAGSFTVRTDAASLGLAAIDAAIGAVSTARAQLGAAHTGFVHASAAGAVTLENTLAAHARIVDADVAVEVSALSRARVRAQAATALMAQWGTARGTVLTLLR